MIRALSDLIDWLETQSPENQESEAPNLPLRFAEDQELSDNQIRMLRKMMQMFVDYNDSKLNLQMLAGIYQLLSNPDSEVMIPFPKRGIDKSLFTFAENIPARQLIEFVLNIVKNQPFKTRKKDLPRFRTIRKDISSSDMENNGFSINTTDINKVRMNFAKRAKSKFSSGSSNSLNLEKGRIVNYSEKGTGNLAITRTILNSVTNGHYSLHDNRFNIKKTDFCYPKYEENIVYNIMLVLDTSDSISWVIPHIEKFISQITSNVSNSRDKLGLITFNNDLAQIYHFPTLNVKQVIGTINKLDVKGKTPLGDGLNLATQVFSRSQFKQMGTKNLIILISDCFPEPLEGGHKDLLNEPSYKLVVSASEKIRDNNIGFIIINPTSKTKTKNNWNKKLIDKILEITDAKYIEINPKIEFNIFKGEKAYIEDESINEFFSAINDVKMNL